MIIIYQLFNSSQTRNLKNIPHEVIQFAKNALSVLDEIYGESRTLSTDGGEVIILTEQDDLSAFDILGIDIERLQPEYSNVIPTSKGVDYLHIFTLTTNEYSRQILIQKNKATPNLLDC